MPSALAPSATHLSQPRVKKPGFSACTLLSSLAKLHPVALRLHRSRRPSRLLMALKQTHPMKQTSASVLGSGWLAVYLVVSPQLPAGGKDRHTEQNRSLVFMPSGAFHSCVHGHRLTETWKRHLATARSTRVPYYKYIAAFQNRHKESSAVCPQQSSSAQPAQGITGQFGHNWFQTQYIK